MLEHLPVAWLPDVLQEAFRVAGRALVVDFYVPPVESGPVRTARVGRGFLETRWTTEALLDAAAATGWGPAHRFTLDRLLPEPDEVWVWTPRGEPVLFPTPAAPPPVAVSEL